MGNKKLLILLLALIMFIALMGLTIGKRESLTWPERFVKDSVSWVQGLFYKPTRAVAGFFQGVHDIGVTYEENQVLKATLAKYAKDTMRLNDLEARNKQLQDMLGFTERQKNADKMMYRIAEVQAVSGDPFSNVINIDLGAKDGIKENMAVMSIEGLLGRVTRVSSLSSTVQLLPDIDDKNRNSKAIAATVKGQETTSFGIIEQFDPETQQLIMTNIDPNDPIQLGDVVITSGLGKVFPRGLEIGRVTKKAPGDFGINYKAYIKPSASFRHLRFVFVVEVPEVK